MVSDRDYMRRPTSRIRDICDDLDGEGKDKGDTTPIMRIADVILTRFEKALKGDNMDELNLVAGLVATLHNIQTIILRENPYGD